MVFTRTTASPPQKNKDSKDDSQEMDIATYLRQQYIEEDQASQQETAKYIILRDAPSTADIKNLLSRSSQIWIQRTI